MQRPGPVRCRITVGYHISGRRGGGGGGGLSAGPFPPHGTALLSPLRMTTSAPSPLMRQPTAAISAIVRKLLSLPRLVQVILQDEFRV